MEPGQLFSKLLNLPSIRAEMEADAATVTARRRHLLAERAKVEAGKTAEYDQASAALAVATRRFEHAETAYREADRAVVDAQRAAEGILHERRRLLAAIDAEMRALAGDAAETDRDTARELRWLHNYWRGPILRRRCRKRFALALLIPPRNLATG